MWLGKEPVRCLHIFGVAPFARSGVRPRRSAWRTRTHEPSPRCTAFVEYGTEELLGGYLHPRTPDRRHFERVLFQSAVDELIAKIESMMISYVRDAMIEEVWKIVLGDIVYVPLHHQRGCSTMIRAGASQAKRPVDRVCRRAHNGGR
jgi:hypothetical protein